VPAPADRRTSRFPSSLEWLRRHQLPDGSWGGEVCYQHDRVLTTLAALAPLAEFGRRASDRAAVEAGTRYLWQRGHLLAGESIELVGFELLLPTLIERAKRAGVHVPPHLDIYGPQRAEKLRLIPPSILYSPRTTAVHSLEFLGDEADVVRLRAAQGANGSIGNSPAATAFFLSRVDDTRALAYLNECFDRTGGAMAPVLYPCETFEFLWSVYHLSLAGVPATHLLSARERQALSAELEAGGVSLSPTFPIPDADDTAVALLMLHDVGIPVDPTVLQPFALPGGHFASFPHERHASVGVNLHVLHALLRVPGYPDRERAIAQLVDYLVEQHTGLYWLDKWHISPFYATAHALCILAELPRALRAQAELVIQRSRDWLRQSQNGDGSWGFYGRGTAEETAYAALALAAPSALVGHSGDELDRSRCAAALEYLREVVGADPQNPSRAFPPHWIDQCLYTPTQVVRAVVEAARIASRRLGIDVHGTRPLKPLESNVGPSRPMDRVSLPVVTTFDGYR
jgi:halimadienyl-diphosphate synthase